MESTLAAAPVSLIQQLDFSLPQSAPFAKSRQQTTYQPSGGTTYGPLASQIIRFSIAESEAFLDPASVKVMFRVKNTNTTQGNTLTPVSNVPSCMFSRMVVKAGGTILEDVNSYNAVSHMFQRTMNSHIVSDMEAEGFAGHTPMNGGVELRVGFTPLSGLLSQSKYIPLRYTTALSIELTVAPSVEWLTNGDVLTNNTWEITQPQLKCDLVNIESALAEQYAAHLLSSAPLPITFSSYHVSTQSLAQNATDFTINLARAVSRLQSVFIFMKGDDTATIKKANALKSPGNEDFSFKLQIGGKRYPLQDCEGFSESRAKLAQAVGIHASSAHGLNIAAAAYRANEFIAAVDTEVVALGSSFSGVDLRAGDLLTVQMKGITQGQITSVTTVLLSQSIANIRDSGLDLLE